MSGRLMDEKALQRIDNDDDLDTFVTKDNEDDVDEHSVGDKSIDNARIRLANLFGSTNDQSTQLLSYVPQKEPSLDDQHPPTNIVYSTVIHAFLLDNNDRQYISQGQVGLALISQMPNCRLLLYLADKRPLTHINLISIEQLSMMITFASPYVSFADSIGRRWSLAFVDRHALLRFATHIFALVLSTEVTSSQDKEIMIDLAVGDGPTIANTDSVLVNIVTYSVQSTTMHVTETSIEESIKLRIGRIGKTSKRWERILPGRKCGAELLFAYRTSNDAIHQFGNIINEEWNIVHIHVKKIRKASTDDSKSATTTIESTDSSTKPDDVNTDVKDSIKERMSRIGHPLVPLKPSSPSSTNTLIESVTAPPPPAAPIAAQPTTPIAPAPAAVIAAQPTTPIAPPPTTSITPQSMIATPTITETSARIDYDTFQRLVGLEMDRLHNRIEFSISKIVADEFRQQNNAIDQLTKSIKQIEKRMINSEMQIKQSIVETIIAAFPPNQDGYSSNDICSTINTIYQIQTIATGDDIMK